MTYCARFTADLSRRKKREGAGRECFYSIDSSRIIGIYGLKVSILV